MKTILTALAGLTAVTLAASAQAATLNHRSYDLRDVQSYSGAPAAECPYGEGYGFAPCPRVQSHAIRHSPAILHKPAGNQAFKAMTAIQNSHNEL